jgi:AAA+ ATPase superfamily predicted ATPase
MRNFVGRQAELQLLDRLWHAAGAQLLVLYGRRRIGKTRLLTHWIQLSSRHSLYWVAVPSTATEQLRSFSQALYNFANPETPAPEAFSYASWEQAWEQLALVARGERIALCIDEFTYLLAADPTVAARLQHAWDRSLSQQNLMLVFSGSHVGMMHRNVLAPSAPLYGRATGKLELQPMPFGASKEFFPRYSAAERVAIYAIFGGVPAYWERVNPAITVGENIRQLLLSTGSLLHDEPQLLLQDFLREPQNYVAIMRAIAAGEREQKGICTFTGLAQGHVSKYLSVLRDSGFIERRLSVTASPQSRSGRYHIRDPYLRFYYRFLAPRQSQLALGVEDQALAEIKRHLIDFIGTHTWEELCREWLLRAGHRLRVRLDTDESVLVDQVGSVWSSDVQVDVVGMNRMTRTMVLGECKWGVSAVGRRALSDLLARAAKVVPRAGTWTVHFVGFARAGWTSAAKAFAEAAPDPSLRGDNWSSPGIKLFDLKQIDHDLTEWSRA